MTEKEFEKTIKLMDQHTKQVTSTKDKALGFLQRAGIVTKKGTLTKAYR